MFNKIKSYWARWCGRRLARLAIKDYRKYGRSAWRGGYHPPHPDKPRLPPLNKALKTLRYNLLVDANYGTNTYHALHGFDLECEKQQPAILRIIERDG